ncbi:MAG: aminopeptidase P family protein [Rhizobiaceae bacterium]|nr:aminopeptidase P family protein [Rhizobiaceae bacterium]MCV0406579.1 aminopeptidase P family protein [Rhizobiaceae bacterium]
MFQSFDSTADPKNGPARVALVRAEMARRGVDAFLVPRADEHQGEYVARRSERLAWLTGFTGSAGAALILADRAIVFVDGRYTLQVRDQTDGETFTYENLVETPPHKWLAAHGAGLVVGFDPWLHTISDVRDLEKAAKKAGATLMPLGENLVDAIWDDQPPPPLEPVFIHPIEFAGEPAKDKLARLAAAIREAGADHAVLTDPSSVAWTFNIRGGDVAHTPLALAFAILPADGMPRLFIDRRKLPLETEAYLTQLADLNGPSALNDELVRLAEGGARIALDPSLAAERLRGLIADNGGTVVEAPDPARIPRATKNAAELAGSRAAHRRDGAAVTTFLAWLEAQEPGSVDEIAAATRLEGFRIAKGEETQATLRDIAFDTISGSGPNGAIIHYRVTTPTNRTLGAGELYLVDSGGQYQDGTTDITRTVAVGEPTDEMRERYTMVLKGLIAVSLLRFPAGTRGCDVDPFARAALWRAGLDFAHGTGHGVGAYLAVHEGPQRIARTGTQKLLPGMIVSNEPGYYKPGAWGIRLENLIVVDEAHDIPGGDIAMHSFETLTLAPFDRRLIVAGMLSAAEREWLDAYHARVIAEVGPMVDADTRAWLERAAAAI